MKKTIFTVLTSLSILFSNSYAEKITLDKNTYVTGALGVINIQDADLDAIYKAEIEDPKTKRKFEFKTLSNQIFFGIHRDFKGDKAIVRVFKNDELIFEKAVPVRKKFYRLSKIWIKRKKRSPEIIARIKREGKLIRKTLRVLSDKHFTETHFFKPLNKISISTPFGARRIINNKIRYAHSGTDFRAKWGTPVKAVLSGKVVIARDFYLTGKTIIIDHGLGLYSLYAHLSKMKVKEGDFVKGGQVIGNVGSTGRSTGPHLHLGIYVNGLRVDPMEAFKTKLSTK